MDMALVKPFKGVRFNTGIAGKIEELVCPPYDVISEEQRKAYIEKNENNIIRLELPKGDNPYRSAHDIFTQWKEKGILKTEDLPAVYIYEEEFEACGKRTKVKGMICRVKIEDFSKGVILPHEFTLSKAKEDRLNLMKATNCNFSQIYSLFMDPAHCTTQKLDSLSTGAPDIHLTDNDNVTHRLWIVTDQAAISSLCADFDDRKLYIADGHHRYETALNYRNWCYAQGKSAPGGAADYQMMMLVDMEHPGLAVFPTHRLVRNLENFDPKQAMAACTQYFTITEKTGVASMEAELDKLFQEDKTAFGFYCGGDTWAQLVLKDPSVMQAILPDKSAATRELDVTVLHTLILEQLFGIDAENMAKQINLTYTKVFDEAIASVKSGVSQCAFILNPTKVTQIRNVAAAGEKMPQKSTYFYPKLITGLVLNELV